MKKKPALLIVVLAFLHETSTAQTPKIIADKIVAQIGDKIILNSDVDTALDLDFDRKDTPKCHLLENQLIQKALAIQAGKDSMISEEELNEIIARQLTAYIQQYGGKTGLEAAAGKSIYEIQQDLREPARERSLANAMRNKLYNNVKITPSEVKDFFERIPKDSLPYEEGQMEINQLIIHPKPNKAIEDYATNQLLSWKQQVEAGKAKFDALAKLYSQDPGSSNQGGQYSVHRSDRNWDPTWFAAIWKLKEGQISSVILSKFGLHIIQMVSRAGDDAVIRHILLLHSVSQPEINKAKSRLDSVRAAVLAGNITVEQALHSFTEAADENGTAQIITEEQESPVGIGQLNDISLADLKNMNSGDISQPQVYKDEYSQQAVRIIFIRSKTPAHQENWKDDYDKIAQRALDQKKNRVLQQWFKDHIASLYVSIDKDFGDCDNITELVGMVKK